MQYSEIKLYSKWEKLLENANLIIFWRKIIQQSFKIWHSWLTRLLWLVSLRIDSRLDLVESSAIS